MTHVLIFCTAEETKPFMRKAHQTKNYFDPGKSEPSMYYLIESRTCPEDRDGFKTELQDGDTYESAFIGASENECAQWLLDNQFNVNFIEQDIFVVADARTAKDDTVLVKKFERPLKLGPGDEEWKFPPYGVLPPKRDQWYGWRVHYEDAMQVYVSMQYVSPGVAFPKYYGRKEEFTDENGVFSVAKAWRTIHGSAKDTEGQAASE